MVDFTLTEEQRALQELARDFARREVLPAAVARDRMTDLAARFPWEVLESASRHGLRTLRVPRELGGAGVDTLTLCVVGEELAAADLGVAVTMDQTWKISHLLYHLATPAQRDRLLHDFPADHRFHLAIAMTEPGSGSDRYAYFDAPDSQLRVVARPARGGWVLNGLKQFISNGGIAKLYVIYASTDPDQGMWRGSTMFLVPAGTPGFRIGRIHEKVGQRLAQNAELLFEDCWVPEEHVLGQPHRAFEARGAFTRGSHVEAGATVLGVGRAAYELALDWANTRVQGGRRIIEHQAMGMLLADMGMEIEAARALLWKAAWAADHQDPYDPRLASMAKVYASEVAHRVAVQAAEIFGGMGIMAEAPVEKLVRDALTFLHSDGTNQIHRVRMGRLLDRKAAPAPSPAPVV